MTLVDCYDNVRSSEWYKFDRLDSASCSVSQDPNDAAIASCTQCRSCRTITVHHACAGVQVSNQRKQRMPHFPQRLLPCCRSQPKLHAVLHQHRHCDHKNSSWYAVCESPSRSRGNLRTLSKFNFEGIPVRCNAKPALISEQPLHGREVVHCLPPHILRP